MGPVQFWHSTMGCWQRFPIQKYITAWCPSEVWGERVYDISRYLISPVRLSAIIMMVQEFCCKGLQEQYMIFEVRAFVRAVGKKEQICEYYKLSVISMAIMDKVRMQNEIVFSCWPGGLTDAWKYLTAVESVGLRQWIVHRVHRCGEGKSYSRNFIGHLFDYIGI